MKISGLYSLSFLRLGIVLFVLALVFFSTHLFILKKVNNSLVQLDSLCSYDGIEYSFDSIIIKNLKLPGMGISSGSTCILLDGSFYHPELEYVVLQSVIYQPDYSSSSSDSGTAISGDLPVIAVVDGFIPNYGTEFFGARRNGFDTGSAEGPWGKVFLNHSSDSIYAVFENCSSVPGIEFTLPDQAVGHSISGVCTGVTKPEPAFSGYITEIDEKSVSADFEYCFKQGSPFVSLFMDFSQISESAQDAIFDLSGGAITNSEPIGTFSLSYTGNDTVFFFTDLEFEELSVWSTDIAPDTFSINIALSCQGYLVIDSDIVVVDSGLIKSNELDLNFSLMYSWGERTLLYATLSNPELKGEAIVNSMPPELLGRLNGLILSGDLSLFAELTLDWDFPDSSDINLEIDASQLRVDYSPIPFGQIRNYTGASCFMRDSWGNSSRIGLDTLTNSDFVFFDSLPFYFEPLLRCAEDATFRRHSGFSEYHIRNSIRANMAQGRFVRGGSTISMQLAKNLFLGREKTLARKLQEVFLTWRLERWLSKDRILEIYANIVELGPGVFGFNAAAMYYFNESVVDISVKEMAFLVSILPGPKLYHGYAQREIFPPHWNSYVERLITICGTRGWLDESVVSRAVADTLIFDGAVSLF